MKKIFFFVAILFFFSKAKAQQVSSISAERLVEIAEQSDFTSLVKLVATLNYLVLDSSRDEKGVLFYFAKEPKQNGNVLACSANAKNSITELTFNTFTMETSVDLKTQLKKLGFKSSGIAKGKISGIIASEDFEKGKLYVATAIVENKQGKNFYEFTFMKL